MLAIEGAPRASLLNFVLGLWCLVAVVSPSLARGACEDFAPAAAQWLEGPGQNPDGSWGSESEVHAVATAEAVLALRAYARRDWAYYQGVTWLENHAMSNVDYTARRVLALLPHGDDVSDDIQNLLAALSADPANPGWGLTDAYVASYIETALAASSLTAYDISIPTLRPSLQWVTDGESGGWPLLRGGSADLDATAIVTRALLPAQIWFPVEAAGASAGVLALSSANYAGVSDLTRAHAALAMLSAASPPAEADVLLSTLEANQDPNGSWGGDAYTTALALHACALKLDTNNGFSQGFVYVPDWGLRRAINATLGKTTLSDGITRAEMQSLTTLDLSSELVTDVTGLEWATFLTQLTLSTNTSPNESPLGGLLGLTVTRPTLAYPAPSGVSATDGLYTDRIEVTWAAIPGATYAVYRTEDGEAIQEIARRLVGNSYIDTSAQAGISYAYQVAAVADGVPLVLSPMSQADTGYRQPAGPDIVVSHVLGSPTLTSVMDLSVGPDGTVYIADGAGAYSVDRAGSVTDLVSAASGTLDSLSQPAGIAVGPDGTVYLSSAAENIVYAIDPVTNMASILIDSNGAGGQPLLEPTDLAVGSAGDLYVVGSSSDNAFVVPVGGGAQEIIDSSGDGNCPLFEPRSIAVSGEDTVFVAGYGSGSWCVFRIASGSIDVVIDEQGDGSGDPDSLFQGPRGLAADSFGRVYAVGSLSGTLYGAAPGGVPVRLLDPSSATESFVTPAAVVVDARGNLVAAAEGADRVHRVTRRKVAGVLLGPAGDGTEPLISPSALAVDPGGNIYVGGDQDVFRVATGAVQLADSATSSVSFGCPSGPVLEPDGTAQLVGLTTDNAVSVTPTGAVAEWANPFTSGVTTLDEPFAVVAGDEGSLYLGELDRVYRRTPWGQLTEVLGPSDGLTTIQAIHANDGAIWAAGFGSSNVVMRDAQGVTTEVVDATGDGLGNVLGSPSALAGNSKALYVADYSDGDIFEVRNDGAAVERICCGPGGPIVAQPTALTLRPGKLLVAGTQSDNVIEIDLATDTATELIGPIGDGTNGMTAPTSLAVDNIGNLLVVAGADVFRRSVLGNVERVLDSSGDGQNSASSFGSVAASSVSDDFLVASCADDALWATSPVPEPAWFFSLPALLLGLCGLFWLRGSEPSRGKQRGGRGDRSPPPVHAGSTQGKSSC